ncbi:MAG: hypothetical protein ACO2PN_12520 [Pyrobaculum sp.]|jgi:hypothetical protein
MDYEECLKRFNDPEMCGFGFKAVQLAETLRLEECLEKHKPQKCLDACLKNCRGENCRELCLNAMDMAAAKGIARRLVQGAVAAASETGISIPEAAAMGFYALLGEPDNDCIAKVISMRVLSFVAIELKNLLGVQEMLLLLAPAVAKAYECIGDSAFNLLDMVEPAIGREMVERIAAALEEGVVKIGRIALTFPPAKPT